LDKEYYYYMSKYEYDSWEPVKIDVENLSISEKHLLKDSDTFCIYPWIHLHSYPTGETYPCCHADMQVPVGNNKEDSLKTIWNNHNMRELRNDLLMGHHNNICNGCYEQESHGFFSGRKSANKHHGHHIAKALMTTDAGTVGKFEMTYWDIRFSNLCNLSCRSCGHIFSSSWHKDQAHLAEQAGDPNWKNENKVLLVSGKSKTDMIDQVMEHIDHVEQIYFAGGEPLMMDEHYVILEELERRERFDVRLIYNTNFTQVKLKDRYVFDYWKKFDSVSVGASLDAMGKHAEYIRKGTKWSTVEDNRRRMMDTCPNVDFYISPTLSIMNAMHITDFHKDWVEKGLLKHQDLNINILQDPMHYRIDIAPEHYKDKIRNKFQEHIKWLEGHDDLQRATNGFISAVHYLDVNNTKYLNTFWEKTKQLDEIRNENMLDSIPELNEIK
jgi:MoaA/NifB/PqqE/SkfB family radical SAM enzyme